MAVGRAMYDALDVERMNYADLGRWTDIRTVQQYSNPSERNNREAIERLFKTSYPKFIENRKKA